MNKNFYKLFVYIILITLANMTLFAQKTNSNHTHVNGYYRNNGTYVQPHYRTSPNSTNKDNFSTLGNTNPYTGQAGWITPDNNAVLLVDDNNIIYTSYTNEQPKGSLKTWFDEHTNLFYNKKSIIPSVNLISLNDYFKTPTSSYPSFNRTSPSSNSYKYLSNNTYSSISIELSKAISYHNRYFLKDKIKLETILNELGYNVGRVDGHIDEATIEAIQAFQQGNLLDIDGKAGPTTFNKLIVSHTKASMNINRFNINNANTHTFSLTNSYTNNNNESNINITKNTISDNLKTNAIQNYNLAFEDYEMATLRGWAKFRKEADAITDIIKEIPVYDSIKIIGFKSNYWQVYYDGYIGYINEMYVKEKDNMVRFKNNKYNNNIIKNTISDNPKTNTIQNYDLTFDDYEIATLRWQAKLTEEASISNPIKEISVYEKIKIIGFKNKYWKVYHDGYIGYVNEMYVKETNNMKRFKNNETNLDIIKNTNLDNTKTNTIQNYNLTFEDYEITTLKRRGKFRKGIDSITDIIKEISVYEKIKIIGFKNNYWKVYYDGYIGYISEIFVEEKNNMNRFKIDNLKANTIQNYNLAFDDCDITTLSRRTKFRKEADAISDIIKEIPAYESVKIIGFKNSYWKVYYDGYVGYINEKYVEGKSSMNRFKK